MKKISLFCDGSCLGNPGVGGWAYIVKFKEHEKKEFGSVSSTTNNQMELLAAIKGLRALKEPCEVMLYTDSSYVANGLNSWLDGWVKKEFKKVKNEEYWKELYRLKNYHKITAIWVRGHSGHKENEECDTMARNAALALQKEI